jgi:hypothetical protein
MLCPVKYTAAGSRINSRRNTVCTNSRTVKYTSQKPLGRSPKLSSYNICMLPVPVYVGVHRILQHGGVGSSSLEQSSGRPHHSLSGVHHRVGRPLDFILDSICALHNNNRVRFRNGAD